MYGRHYHLRSATLKVIQSVHPTKQWEARRVVKQNKTKQNKQKKNKKKTNKQTKNKKKNKTNKQQQQQQQKKLEPDVQVGRNLQPQELHHQTKDW